MTGPLFSPGEDVLTPCERMRRFHLEEKVILLHRLRESVGPEFAEVVEENFAKPLRRIWADTAPDTADNAIDDLIEVLWRCNTHLFDFSERPCKDGVQVQISRCLFHEVATELNALAWGERLFCSDYEYIVARFNPNIAFYRTQSLMRGHACCEFYYFLKGGTFAGRFGCS